MRPPFSWPQQLLALGAVFLVLTYGISMNAQARELHRYIYSFHSMPLVKTLLSPLLVDAQENSKKKQEERQTDERKRPTPTPTPQHTPKPSPAAPSPTPSLSPTSTPEPTETPLPPIAIVTPSPSPTPVTPIPTPEQVALNIDPAKNLINDAVQTIRDATPFEAFKVDGVGSPYPYGNGKLDAPTTVKLYGLAGAITMLGIAFLNFKTGKQS